MAPHSHHYHHRGFLRFGKVCWNPRWCQSGNDPTMLSLRLENLSNCIPHLCHSYIRCLNTLNSCGWGYGSTFIPLPPQRFPQIWESSLKSYINVEMIPLRYRWGGRTFQTASHPCHTYIRCLNTLNSCGCAYACGVKMMSKSRGLEFSPLLPMGLASQLKRRTSSSAQA